jgi:serine/threonine-protein kinase
VSPPWPEISRVVDLALALEPSSRPAWLDRTCSGDAELRRAVERLLDGIAGAEAGFLDGAAATDAAPLLSWVARQGLVTGTRFGPYEILEPLGRGGMATVYLARDHKHHRRVAVKVLHHDIAAAVGREWFIREIDTAAALHHPHILPLHDSGSVDGLLYYVMPLVEGESLRQRLTREGPLPLATARRVVQEVAGALDYAHRQGVVHRDIKPENILLQDGQAIVADFGIARAIATGVVEAGTADTVPAMGTPAYMSPEQASGASAIDGRTDVYALGCVLYEMLEGAPPFGGTTMDAILARHASEPAPVLHRGGEGAARRVEGIIHRALEKMPADRFATAGELATALDAAAAGSAGPPSTHRHRRALLGAAAALGVAAAVGVSLRWPRDAPALSQKVVAILPFQVSASTPELAWLREGLPDLLAIKLSGEGGLRAAEPRAVLNAWRQAAGPENREPTAADRLGIARALRAGRVLDGGVVGTPAHLVLTASLRATTSGRALAEASADGPADSVSVMVDRLAGRLLSLSAGVTSSQLTSLTTTSLPAIRAYLAGRSAFRAGRRDDALRDYRDALGLDSTFALAALEQVHTAIWAERGGDVARAKRLALAGRDRLSPADRALLDLWTGPFPTGPDWFERLLSAAKAYPDRPEIWYELGDQYFHNGALVGLEEPLRSAAYAFERGWALDSASTTNGSGAEGSPIFAEPLNHMVEIAQVNGDIPTVRRLVALGLAVDSTGKRGTYLRWHRAVTRGSAARREFWADTARLDADALGGISEFIQWSGVAAEDLLRASRLDTKRVEGQSPGSVGSTHASTLLNGGRPGEASRLVHTDDTSTADLRGRIFDALYWGLDTSAAASAADRLARRLNVAVARGQPGRDQLKDLCAVATWRSAHGDFNASDAALARLRKPALAGLDSSGSIGFVQHATLCATLLEARRATALHAPDARAKLQQADLASRTDFLMYSQAANLVVARLAEAQGDLALALRAVRRGAGGFGTFPWYRATFLREEGRLAALAGDTAGAVRAFRHYLAIRPVPEPEAATEDAAVRARLAELAP